MTKKKAVIAGLLVALRKKVATGMSEFSNSSMSWMENKVEIIKAKPCKTAPITQMMIPLGAVVAASFVPSTICAPHS